MNIDQILKKGGYPNTPQGIKDFYKAYPTKEAFEMKFGGIAFPQAPTADKFFSNTFAPNTPRGFYAQGGNLKKYQGDKGGSGVKNETPNYNRYMQDLQQYTIPEKAEGGVTNRIAFPQAPDANLFFSAYPAYATGGGLPGGANEYAPCYECNQSNEEGGSVSAFNYGQFPAIMEQGGGDYAKGGWIKKVSKSMEKRGTKGSFTKYCGGKVTDECIQRGLNSPDPLTRKRAGLAKAFRSMSKKAEGGDAGYGLDSNDVGQNLTNYFLNATNSFKEKANMDDAIEEAMKYEDYMNAYPVPEARYGQQTQMRYPGVYSNNYNGPNPNDNSAVWNAYNQAYADNNNIINKGSDLLGAIGMGSLAKYKEFIPKKAQSQITDYTDMPAAPYLPDDIANESIATKRRGGSLKKYQSDVDSGNVTDENYFNEYPNPYEKELEEMRHRQHTGIIPDAYEEERYFDPNTIDQLKRLHRRYARKMGIPRNMSDYTKRYWEPAEYYEDNGEIYPFFKRNPEHPYKPLSTDQKKEMRNSWNQSPISKFLSRKKRKQQETQTQQGTGQQNVSNKTQGTQQGTQSGTGQGYPSSGLTVTYGPMGWGRSRFKTMNEAYAAPQNVWASTVEDDKRGPFGIFGRNKKYTFWHSPSMNTVTNTNSNTNTQNTVETEEDANALQKAYGGDIYNYATGGPMTYDYMQSGGESRVMNLSQDQIDYLVQQGIDVEYLD